MSGGHFSHAVRVSRSSALIGVLALGMLAAPSAVAFEAFDGRLQMHGFFESTMRALNGDFSEDWDVAQWYMIFNLEFEMDLVQDRIGPIDLLSAYVRAEVRYDCVYSSGCGMFRSMNAYGDRSKSLPRRLQNTERNPHAGRIRIPRDPEIPIRLSGTNTDPLTNGNQPALALFADGGGGDGIGPGEECDLGVLCSYVAGAEGVTPSGLSPVAGPGTNAGQGTEVPVSGKVVTSLFAFNDNPFEEMERLGDFGEFRWFSTDGSSSGPWLPKNFFETNFTLSAQANPFDDRVGSYALQASNYSSYLIAAEPFINSPDLDPAVYGAPGSQMRTDTAVAQAVAAAANGEDQNSDGFVYGTEDQNGNGWLDYLEDVNFNGVLDPGEDTNGDGILQTEDWNGNGYLDYYEDLNGNGNIAPVGDDAANDVFAMGANLEDFGAYTAVGAGELPYRPVPLFREDGARDAMGNLVNQATDGSQARGLFIPSLALRRSLERGDLEPIERSFNFSESQRQWNRGESQRDEKELKEAYLDIELLDNRLWLRVGKQQIVWGKTELFRTTDQFNPGDAALASLPSLEESRIALWSARAVYSFYEVGPLDDVRIEFALNFDDYQSTDLGACGEAYTPDLVCALTFGAFAHGLFGLGVAGFDEPEDPWSSTKGIEVGVRLEWRYGRFSFALMDFWGYDDFPTIELISTFTRNVDPRTGRPREFSGASLLTLTPTRDPYTGEATSEIQQIGAQGICLEGYEDACLTSAEALTHAATAQQLYAFVCGGTVGFSALDTSACALNVFGSQGLIIDAPPVQVTTAQGIGLLLAGSPDTVFSLSYLFDTAAPAANADLMPSSINEDSNGNGRLDDNEDDPRYMPGPDGFEEVDLDGNGALSTGGRGGFILPFVQLQAGATDYGGLNDSDQRHNPPSNYVRIPVDPSDPSFDPNDPSTHFEDPPECVDSNVGSGNPQCGSVGGGLIQSFSSGPLFGGQAQGLGATLSPEQEALLGCGPFWGTQCDDSGVDLLNAEGSALFQAWPGVEGTTLPFANVGNGGPADVFRKWRTNQRNDASTAFLDQPGTRNWFFAPSDRDPLGDFAVNGAPHAVGALCTTANFGGALYDGSSGSDYANGNQDVLPGCRNKWRKRPIFENLTQSLMDADLDGIVDVDQRQNLLSMNWYGQDAICAQEIATGSPSASCQYLNDWMVGLDTFTDKPGFGDPENLGPDPANAPKDHRSWDYVKDGDPDGLGLGVVATVLPGLFGIPFYQIRTPTLVPDFYYRRPGGPFGAALDPYSATNRACPGDASYTGFPEAQVNAAGGSQFVPCGKGGHPLTGQPFANEMAALSWNFMVLLIDQELGAANPDSPLWMERARHPYCPDNSSLPDPMTDCKTDYEITRDVYLGIGSVDEDANGNGVLDPGEDDNGNGELDVHLHQEECSLATPELCGTFRALMGSIGLQRNIRRAGGNGTHGRRTLIWQSGGEVKLSYQKRNVLGFSMDFAEDVTKTNFSVESTWLEGVPVGNNDKYSGLDRVDQFNLTISVDRPTFINFLNANRTFFFNAQLFAGYVSGWQAGMTAQSPWSFLGTFAVGTGYFQDRLSPSMVTVYDFNSQSGAVLTSISYRFTQNFSAAFGMYFFYGRPDTIDQAVAGVAPASNISGRAPDDLYRTTRAGGLAIVQDRDELWARIRYTF